ncbi:MAG: hypothetical protein IT379_29215 [Deltaproteobacteria bacterium]|nr:hypothetical protein [Deltaproteobacteria bacterium]
MTTEPTPDPAAPAAGSSNGAEAATPPVAPADAAKTPPPEPALPDTPEAALVSRAKAAFEAGDFRRAREHARGALASSDDAVRRAAEDVLARTRLDPVQAGLFLACLALFVGITYWFVLR